jgi:ankyrin repeat protein
MPKTIKESEEDTTRIINRVLAHRDFFKYVSNGDVKEMEQALEKEIDINYVEPFFYGEIRCERTALIIALQNRHSDAVKFLIENKADVNQALSLAFIHYSKEDSLQSELISEGADVEQALRMAIEHDWEGERQERLGKAKILSLALVKQPKNASLHNNNELISRLISKGADLNRTLCLVLEDQPENMELIPRLISKGADLNRTLCLVLEDQPENMELISRLISKGADLNRTLCLVLEDQPENMELISRLISKGADVNFVIDPEMNYRVLHKAIDSECAMGVIHYLLEYDADPDEKVIVARGGYEKIGFALMTMTNPIGWFYLSYLFCCDRKGCCGNSANPFQEKYVDAMGLAQLKSHWSAVAVIMQYKANIKTPLLTGKEHQKNYGGFFYQGETAIDRTDGVSDPGGHVSLAIVERGAGIQ